MASPSAAEGADCAAGASSWRLAGVVPGVSMTTPDGVRANSGGSACLVAERVREAANLKVNADPPRPPGKPRGLATAADTASAGIAAATADAGTAKDAAGGATARGVETECEARARAGREGPCGGTAPAGRVGTEAAGVVGWRRSSGCCCGATRLRDCMAVGALVADRGVHAAAADAGAAGVEASCAAGARTC